MPPIRRCLKPLLLGALALSTLAYAPFGLAAEYCVGTVSQLQNALNDAEVDGQDSEIRIKSGTYAVSGNIVYQPVGEYFLAAGKLTLRGGYNSDCSSRVDTDGATRFTGDGSRTLRALTQTGNVSLAGLAFEGVHVTLKSEVFQGCGALDRDFNLRRVRITSASAYLFSQCHNVLVDNVLIVNGVRGPDIIENSAIASTGLLMRFADVDGDWIGEPTMVNSTVINANTLVTACCDRNPRFDAYNTIFEHSANELRINNVSMLAKNSRWDSVNYDGLGGLLAASENNTTAAAALDAEFYPTLGSAMRNSGTGTVPGGLSAIDQAGSDRVIGIRVDRGARENLTDGSGIYTVTNTATSGTGSLSWAIAQANAEPGFNRIAFAIPGSGCPKVISVPSALIVNERLAIDGFSQPGAQINTLEGNLWNGLPCVLLRGPNGGVGIETGGDLGTERLSITGLAFERFDLAVSLLFGQDHSIHGSQFGGEIGNTGLTLAGNDQAIALVGGRDTLIGGSFPSHRNLIGSSSDVGVLITQFIGLGGEGITIRNNLIGSDKDGIGSLPNGDGIRISGPDNVVQENVIAGNTRDGIVIAGSNATGNTVVGNSIGGNLDLVTFLQGNGRMGIMVENGASQNVIGPDNRIGRNGDDGIRIFSDAGGRNRITGNLLALNDAMGIDLGANGVTANDNDPAFCAPGAGCAANGGQNYPVLSEAERKTQGIVPINTPVRIRGTLRSVVGGPYRIEIFVSDDCEANGHGEARRSLATTVLTIPNEPYCPPGGAVCIACSSGNCTKDFSVWVPELGLETGDVITTTATSADGNTSEFSACETVTREPLPDELFKSSFEFTVGGN
jgi:hypothetical protein